MRKVSGKQEELLALEHHLEIGSPSSWWAQTVVWTGTVI